MSAALKRPRPIMGVYEKPFWDHVQARDLRLPRCKACAHTWFPPGPVCPECLSEEWSYEPVAGTGKVVAWTVFHRQYFPDLPVPYAVVSVELPEGPLLIGNLPGVDPATIRLGMPVRVTYETATSDKGDWVIYQFAPDAG